MARLIVKSPYIKGKGKGGYLQYIGTRDGVELLPAGYMEYMAQRPRSHGLFGDQDHINLNAVMGEGEEYPGNIWTHIISLRREDAERLGYDRAASWRNLLRAHRNEIAQAMSIPPQDFRWYAAFHDEGAHPHVHMMAWSVKPGQAYLSKEGIRKIRSTLTNEVFRQEMLHIYEQKSASRDELVRESRRAMKKLARQMRQGICDSPVIEQQMAVLMTQLETAKGKKKYGYLSQKTKVTVNEIVDQLEKLPAVDQCYQTWWELQCEIQAYYSEKQRKRPPLSERKEFRAIKNAVIQETENIRLGLLTFKDEEMEDEVDEGIDTKKQAATSKTDWELIDAYQEAKAILDDEEAGWTVKEVAVSRLERLWTDGLTVAAHQLGKCYRDGLGVIPDDEKAEQWFRRAADVGLDFSQYALGKLLQEQKQIDEAVGWYGKASAQGNQYADYRLGKLHLTGTDVPKDVEKALRHLTASAEAGNQYAQYILGKLYLMGQDVSQDRALAKVYLTASAEQGNQYAQFFLDRWDTMAQPSIMLSATRLLYHMSQIFRGTPAPRDSTTMHHRIDRKKQAQIREKKITMSHKKDDYEEEQTWGSMSMSSW